MTPDDRNFLSRFFRNLARRALDPTDDLYVHLYEHQELASDDPVELLARGVEWAPGGGVQLLSGFRGTGKSTELRRLRQRLEESGYVVVLFDVENYLNVHVPVDVVDFLVALAGAFSDGLVETGVLGDHPSHRGYWDRFWSFLTRTKVNVDELSFSAGPVGVKAALQQDPDFRDWLQEKVSRHLGELVRDVHGYFTECVNEIKAERGPAQEVVLLVDSVEHIRGGYKNAEEVQDSVERLFSGHPDKLHLPGLHVVYTVPPFLKVRFPGIGALYDPGGLQLLPAVKVRTRGASDPFQPGLDVLEQVIEKRGNWRRLLGERSVLDELSRLSGGHLRDLLRMLMEVARRARRLPVTAETVDAAVNQVRNELLPIPDADAERLRRVGETHDPSLADRDHLKELTLYLDTHLILGYRNGDEWYDVHPLIAKVVGRQVELLARERRAKEHPTEEPERPE